MIYRQFGDKIGIIARWEPNFKNSAELTEKQLVQLSLFIMKVQAALINRTSRFTFYQAQVFSSEVCKIFRNTFEKTNNSVEHLRSYKVLFVDFVIISSRSHLRIFVEKVGDNSFMAKKFIHY